MRFVLPNVRVQPRAAAWRCVSAAPRDQASHHDERIQFVPVAAKTREVRRDGLRQRRRLRKAGECAKAGERRLVPSKAMHPDRVGDRDVVQCSEDGTEEGSLVSRQRRGIERRDAVPRDTSLQPPISTVVKRHSCCGCRATCNATRQSLTRFAEPTTTARADWSLCVETTVSPCQG